MSSTATVRQINSKRRTRTGKRRVHDRQALGRARVYSILSVYLYMCMYAYVCAVAVVDRIRDMTLTIGGG